MQLGPILRSMRHHKGAFSLLVLEVAFGFMLLVHVLIAAHYYFHLGVEDPRFPCDDLVVVERRFLHPRAIPAARDQQRSDLTRLGALPGVVGVAGVDMLPLPDSVAFPVVVQAPAGSGGTIVWTLRATPRVTAALGLKLVEGRELGDVPEGAAAAATAATDIAPALITRALAERLFGEPSDALGRVVDAGDRARGRVVGVVEDFSYRGTAVPSSWSNVILAGEPVSEHHLIYVLRAAAGRRPAVVDEVRGALGPGSPGSGDAIASVRPLALADLRFSRISRGAVAILLWTGLLVVAVTLAGSLALSSFSVAERTRQIGVRRALGAARGEIVRYFLLENVLLTGIGLGLGLVLAVGLNYVLRQIMPDIRLSAGMVVLSAAVFVVTGMLSALVPARRAAAIPPWAATRTL